MLSNSFTKTNLQCSLQVQIRPWNLSDSDFVMDGSQPLDPRKTIFVGGVPRPLRAGEHNENIGHVTGVSGYAKKT